MEPARCLDPAGDTEFLAGKVELFVDRGGRAACSISDFSGGAEVEDEPEIGPLSVAQSFKLAVIVHARLRDRAFASPRTCRTRTDIYPSFGQRRVGDALLGADGRVSAPLSFQNP